MQYPPPLLQDHSKKKSMLTTEELIRKFAAAEEVAIKKRDTQKLKKLVSTSVIGQVASAVSVPTHVTLTASTPEASFVSEIEVSSDPSSGSKQAIAPTVSFVSKEFTMNINCTCLLSR